MIKINFEEIRMNGNVSFDLYDYIEEMFAEKSASRIKIKKIIIK